MGGGRLRRTPLIKYKFYVKKIQKLKIQQKTNDSLHLLRFGRLKTDLKS